VLIIYVVYNLGGKAGFPFIVVSCRLFFVSRAGSSFVSLRQPTKNPTAISTSYHFNPCRSMLCTCGSYQE